MKDNIGISFGIQGMERQNFQHLDDEKVFTFQRNGNLETDENSIGLTNEHSNLLCSRFKPGYKVIGHKVDMLYNKVYFFLTNVDSGVSEIGFIKFNKNIEDGDDIVTQCGCNKILELGTSLEDLEQYEYCTYETLLTDCCNEESEKLCTKCLNFDINYPITSIELKHEVLGTMLLFTDGLNPPRYINLDDLEQYKTKHSYGVYQESINNFYKPSLLEASDACPIGYVLEGNQCVKRTEGTCADGFEYNPITGLCESIISSKLDLNITIDVSGSVNATEMQQQKEFTKTLLTRLKPQIDGGVVRVHLSVFSSTYKSMSDDYLSDFNTLYDMVDRLPVDSGGTYTHLALIGLYQMAKEKAKNAVKFLVLTDGSDGSLASSNGSSYVNVFGKDLYVAYPQVKYFANSVSEFIRQETNIKTTTIVLGEESERADVIRIHCTYDAFGNYMPFKREDNSLNYYSIEFSQMDLIIDDLLEDLYDVETQPLQCSEGTLEGNQCVIRINSSEQEEKINCVRGNLINCSDSTEQVSEEFTVEFGGECKTCIETILIDKECECSEEIECKEDVCLDCDKIRIFPLFETPTLTAEKVQFGGRLKMGTYEFAIAYCDMLGNERTSYYSFTNKIKIFDEELAKFGNEKGEEVTNYGIRLEASNLDKRFSYYKVMVIQTSSSNAVTSVFEEGIHPITDSEIIYTSDVGLKPSTLNRLYLQKPSFKTWNGLTVANNYLFGYGYTKEEEWNLQPIGVLMGALIEWQTDVASEKLYTDGIGNESSTGYMRDEVYPLSFRVHTDYGYTSPLVNLVGRPATKYDLDVVTSKSEVQTIFEGVGDCAEINRKHRWQFYNTATEGGVCSDYNSMNGDLVRKRAEDSCVIPVNKVFENGNISITETTGYINLTKYIEEHTEDICDPKSVEYYNPTLCSIINYESTETCEPEFTYPICSTDCSINYCDVPELVPFEDDKLFKNEVVEILNEQLIYHDKDVANYEQQKKTDYCMIAESDDYSSSIDYVTFESITGITDAWKDNVQDVLADDDRVWNKEVFITDLADREPLKLVRKSYVEYNDCNNSMALDSKLDFYFTNVIERDKSKLLSKRKSRAIGKFTEDLGKNALWYNIEFLEEDFKIVEIGIGLKDSGYKDSTVGDNIVRVSIYNSCGASATLVDAFTVKLEEGKIFRLDKASFPRGVAYIALDTELKTIKTDTNYHHRYKKYREDFPYPDTSEKYINVSTSVCSFIQVRDKEYDSIDVTFDKLFLEKTLQYETTCTYIIPKLNECIAQPYKYGKFGYWESTDEYPNNNELYNSKNLKIQPSDILGYEKEFEKHFKSGLDAKGNYILNDNANVTCKPIRHFKFPDNTIAPFMEYENSNDPFTDSRIYPLGVKFNKDLIEKFLDIAYKNNLITKKQRESITDVEFFRGDRRIHKSILYKGIANDMYKDEVRENTYFRNFPYNSLGKNVFLSNSEARTTVIDHPFKSRANNRFSVIAPELYYNLQTQNPSELSIEGYMYGHSFGSFKEVEDHSKWVILGSKLTKLAKRFATLETSAEIAMGAGMLADAFNGFRVGFANNPMTPASIALGVVTNVLMIASKVATSAKHTISWLNSFKDMGSPHNFASMYISPKGWYNSFKPNTFDNNRIRGLKTRTILKPGINQINEESYITRINNRDRETSLYLYLGNGNELNYPANYINYDNSSSNSSKSSRYVASSFSNEYGVESVRNIASPYFSLKNFIPNQYGKIDGVKWLSTGKKIKLKYNIGCETIFGGDITISRISLKNKVPFFNVNAMKLANRTPIKYSLYSNLAHATYYCDYDSYEESLGISDLPSLTSKYNFDGLKSSNTRYISDPAKFFLFMYGIPTFLVESEINGNFRYHGKERHEQYAERVDVYDWVQEKNTPIAYNNIFYYNNIFDTPQTSAPSRILPGIYSKKDYAKLANLPNGIVYSQPDNSEISLDNPWLVFKPYDETLFKTDYGQLIKMKGIESEQVLGVFENNSVVFNAVDTLRDRITSENEELGTGGIFATRPMEFTHNELGDTGSQHSVIVSTEFGHFTIDAKRGKVNLIQPNAKGLNVISDMRGDGGESGMRKWFKRHLPFKIHKYGIEGLTELDTDNPYKGIGILAWWDSTFKRLFITKKDYIPLVKNIKYKDKEFYLDDVKISLKDTRYFKDVSWTVGYSALYQSWVSYYDFIPDYAITYPDYFQTGLNYAKSNEVGLWSHLLTNKSFQVFYGKLYPWEIEIPIKNTYTGNYLKDLKVWSESKRYINDYDFSVFRNRTFNKAFIYNNTNNSGELNLTYEDTMNKRGYPKKISNTAQEVAVTHFDNVINVNYFYNRVIKSDNNLNVWKWDSNEIYKSLNSDAISMNSKRVLERLRGDWFTVRLIQDKSSQFKHMFKWIQYNEKSY